MKMYLVVIMVVLMLLLAVIQSFQLKAIKDELTSKNGGSAATSSSGQISPIIQSNNVQQPQQSQPQMVGGC